MTHKRRVLSQRTHRARKDHICDTCEHLICPTDLYEVTVSLTENGSHTYLYVRKEHVHPGCPYDPSDQREWDFFSEPVPFRIAA